MAVYTLIPDRLSEMAERELQAQLALPEQPQVVLESEPRFKMLAGRFDGGEVVLTGPVFGGVRVDRVTIDLDPFRLNVLESIRSGRLVTVAPLSGAFKVGVPEDEIARLVGTNARGSTVTGVELEEGAARIGTEALVFGYAVPVAIVGDLNVRGEELVFQPENIEAFGTPVPQASTQELLQGVSFSYPLTWLPFGGEITDVSVEQDRVVFEGEMRGLQVETAIGTERYDLVAKELQSS